MLKLKNSKSYIDALLVSFCEKNKPLSQLLNDALFPGRRSRSVLFLSLLKNEDHINESNNIAVAIELVHRASIILDDLIDKDLMRRRRETFHVKHGSDNTILVSNILIASAYNLIFSSNISHKDDLILLFSNTHKAMIIGEMNDIGTIKSYGMKGYMNYLLKKTSALYELAFAAAAMVNDYDDKQIENYSRIGRLFGQIYQSHNDIYDDLYADKSERGNKEVWRFSLSLTKAMAYELGDKKARRSLEINYTKENLNEMEYSDCKQLYLNSNIISECKKVVQSLIDEVTLTINSLKSERDKTLILSSLKKINKNEYHNHYEFAKAGY